MIFKHVLGFTLSTNDLHDPKIFNPILCIRPNNSAPRPILDKILILTILVMLQEMKT